jgi:hypothetical protein
MKSAVAFCRFTVLDVRFEPHASFAILVFKSLQAAQAESFHWGNRGALPVGFNGLRLS